MRMPFIVIVFVLSSSARTAHGQAISFLRQPATPGFDWATRVAVNATGVYVAGITDSGPIAGTPNLHFCAQTRRRRQ